MKKFTCEYLQIVLFENEYQHSEAVLLSPWYINLVAGIKSETFEYEFNVINI